MRETQQRPAAGWYKDPSGRHQGRYWDGQSWTSSVIDAGVVATDAYTPPAPHEASRTAAAVAKPGKEAAPGSRRVVLVVVGILAGVALIGGALVAGAFALFATRTSVAQTSSVVATSSVEPTAAAAAPAAQAEYPSLIPAGYEYAGATANQKAWALALGGVLTEMNYDSHSTLSGVPDAPGVQSALEDRMDMWGIKDRGDLIEMLDWLAAEGHRKEFAGISAAMSQATPAQVEELRGRYKGDPQSLAKLDLVAKYGPSYGSKGIAAWDIGRYVSLCRWGYALGYLDEEEAWSRIMPVAQTAQTMFGSWNEYGKNYATGRAYWAGDPAAEAEVMRIVQDLRASGPWGTIAWDTPLGQAK